MKNNPTDLKHFRIPLDVIHEIEQEAAEKKSDFSKVANYRLKHFGEGLTPSIMAEVQDIVNTAVEYAGESRPDEIEDLRERTANLWKKMK